MNTKASEKHKHYRQRQKEKGLVELRVWVTPEEKKELEQHLSFDRKMRNSSSIDEFFTD